MMIMMMYAHADDVCVGDNHEIGSHYSIQYRDAGVVLLCIIWLMTLLIRNKELDI